MEKYNLLETVVLDRIEKYGQISRNECTDLEAATLRSLSARGIIEGFTANKTVWWRFKKQQRESW